MSINLKGKSVLVTGGSAGLGASIATQFASEGANVVLTYNSSKERAEDLSQKLEKEYGVKVFAVKADSFLKETGQELVDITLEKLGSLDVVVSNAGWTRIVPHQDLESLDEELWDNCLNINIKAHFYLFKAAKKVFDTNNEGGSFIVSASVAGRIATGSSIPYAVSKAGLIHLVKLLAKSQGPKSRVHAVCPGLLLTEWGKKFPQESIEAIKNRSPLKEVPDVDETAAQFIFLARLKTSTGSVVEMDSGTSI